VRCAPNAQTDLTRALDHYIRDNAIDSHGCHPESENRKQNQQSGGVTPVGSLLLHDLIHARNFREWQIGIQQVQLLTDRRRQLQRIERRANHQILEAVV
jgi:hypothetical protein